VVRSASGDFWPRGSVIAPEPATLMITEQLPSHVRIP
jgi:hypothetical protein